MHNFMCIIDVTQFEVLSKYMEKLVYVKLINYWFGQVLYDDQDHWI